MVSGSGLNCPTLLSVHTVDPVMSKPIGGPVLFLFKDSPIGMETRTAGPFISGRICPNRCNNGGLVITEEQLQIKQEEEFFSSVCEVLSGYLSSSDCDLRLFLCFI